MKSKGFSLIELAVVLAIIAILAAILTPLVTQYVDEARVNRASEEARLVAQGVNLFQRDTGRYPVYASLSAVVTDTDFLYGGGTAPTFSVTWAATGTMSLQTRINSNYLSLPTTLGTGRVNYRGPYTASVDADPWGNQFIAVVPVGTGASPQYSGYVISAGPNGAIETTKLQAQSSGVTAGGDDLIARIK